MEVAVELAPEVGHDALAGPLHEVAAAEAQRGLEREQRQERERQLVEERAVGRLEHRVQQPL